MCGTKYLSLRIRESIATGIFNPRNNRGRHKRSYMETSFEQWLTKNCPNLEVIIEQPFPRLDIIKTYFGDFYFPSLSLLIELDGTQHLKTIEYDIERDNYIKDNYHVQIIRISHKEYQTNSKLELVKQLLEI